MDQPIPNPTPSSTVTESCVSSHTPSSSSAAPFYLLEISLISAQDLAPISKSMQTYAMAWINPNKKHTTRTDQQGNKNPMWNDKFVFRLTHELLHSETATVTVEIYTVSWFRDVLVGMVRVLISDLITPLIRTLQSNTKNTRFVALQVRRPSGTPQGILNMGISLLDSTMRSMPLKNYASRKNAENKVQDSDEKNTNPGDETLQKNEELSDEKRELNAKIHLWRSLSAGSEINNEDFPVKPGSICNGSMVNGSLCNGSIEYGSELCSDIGPSASIVAAEVAKKLQPPPDLMYPSAINTKEAKLQGDHQETGSSILEELTIEEAKAKGYRVASKDRSRRPGGERDGNESELSIVTSGRSRRNPPDGGLFSCFGNAYGIEFTIVCGASKNANSNKSSSSKRKKPPSKANSA
ncbi:hypothetical protein Sango_0751600 [Sesamum angolense]|uniref:C2 domain-containing protein n=1 Tax=Sesamum angolense TaxID=2727404 RepID=A0AAE1X227_9LAMI|nr:hypothetical protein Sango_0751600 [Sesamum angolense]